MGLVGAHVVLVGVTASRTHVVTASLADKASTANLRRWMLDGDVPILRVNAAGILAKLPGQGQADQVARVLAHDEEVRHLYMTAVTSRVCAVDWTTAGRIVSQPASYGPRADFLATRFAREALNPGTLAPAGAPRSCCGS
ncbi:hypothetical protein ACFYO5_37870 [Streptomyces sp. NPDC006259]|uniref:hypothetical protein n=1 Tax=Streptomyces sp. NPDC006259 TaxID=3364740 RepID=UPI0036A34424